MVVYYILDEFGEPVPCEDVLVWALFFEHGDGRVVLSDWFDHPCPPTDDQIGIYTSPLLGARDVLKAAESIDLRIHVSTVFLGLDHNFAATGPPVLWETMIFGGPPELSGFQRRYASRQDAIEGHAEACATVRAALAVATTEQKPHE